MTDSLCECEAFSKMRSILPNINRFDSKIKCWKTLGRMTLDTSLFLALRARSWLYAANVNLSGYCPGQSLCTHGGQLYSLSYLDTHAYADTPQVIWRLSSDTLHLLPPPKTIIVDIQARRQGTCVGCVRIPQISKM